jgi:hypothetical protein
LAGGFAAILVTTRATAFFTGFAGFLRALPEDSTGFRAAAFFGATFGAAFLGATFFGTGFLGATFFGAAFFGAAFLEDTFDGFGFKDFEFLVLATACFPETVLALPGLFALATAILRPQFHPENQANLKEWRNIPTVPVEC